MRAQLSDILLSLEVSVLLFSQFVLFFILSVACLYALKILFHYKKGATTALQYTLEKHSYLVIVIIQVVLLIKILLVPFFTYTLNELSTIVPGAMCGAGVLNSNDYGEMTLFLKLIVIMLALLWMVLNKQDQKVPRSPYFTYKLWFFLFIYVMFLIELFLEVKFFTTLSTAEPVSCCSSIYTQNNESKNILLSLSFFQLLGVFYLVYIGIVVSALVKNKVLLLISSILFVYIAYYTVIYDFGIYIYELPTHKCPFCMLQSDYYYVGYFIFSSLFIATFYAFATVVYPFVKFDYKRIIFWYSIFIFFTSLPFVIYIVKNGTLL